jgi:hypothetical protein
MLENRLCPSTLIDAHALTMPALALDGATSFSTDGILSGRGTGIFGVNPLASSISGEVYNDLHGTGSLTAADPGLDNWTVVLQSLSVFFHIEELTHGGGKFDFGGLPPGTYAVFEVLQSGWLETQPKWPSSIYTITVTAGTNSGGWNFGNFLKHTIIGNTFADRTGAGVFRTGDPELPGWTIDLRNADGGIIQQQVTDQNGNYAFTDVGPGTYTVQEELQNGWIQTFPAPPGTYAMTSRSGSNQSRVNFGNFRLVTFSGTVFNDLNGNGIHDAGERGLQGWTVNLYGANGSIVATTTSAEDGSYSFTNVGPGNYRIGEVHRVGWHQTDPIDPRIYTQQAISGTNPSGLDFGNYQLGTSVFGAIFNGMNSFQDSGEPGAAIEMFNPESAVSLWHRRR